MTKPFKPMLAEDVVDFTTLIYPLYGSFKVDGVRALMKEDLWLPRSLKQFGNKAAVDWFEGWGVDLNLMEGEATLGGNPTLPNLCRATTSALSSHDGAPEIHWWIFDHLDPDPSRPLTFSDRLTLMKKRFKELGRANAKKARVHLLEQKLLRTPAEVEAFEKEALQLGYEGIVLKSPDGLYKHGRSTLKSQQFLRVKRFVTAEIRITGFVERQQNNNEATVNKLGHKTRSSHKANKVGVGTLGTIQGMVVSGPFTGQDIEIGTGWDAVTGQWIWDNRDKLLTELVEFQYFPLGVKDKPRFPTFLGFRAKFDMSN